LSDRTGHSVRRDSQIFVTVKIYTLVSKRQAHTIQIVRAHARDLTMAAAGHAYGMARVAPGIICSYWRVVAIFRLRHLVNKSSAGRHIMWQSPIKRSGVIAMHRAYEDLHKYSTVSQSG